MTRSTRSTHQRLIQAALHLFATQGITETTTRQIAELAEVNEVTLFRHFGSKYGLLLAVIEDMEVFSWLGETLGQQAVQTTSISEALETYASLSFQGLEQMPELVRSLIGEAGQYPPENRQALRRGLSQANQHTAQYLNTVMRRQHLQPLLSVEKLASLLNSLLVGYVVLNLISESDDLWSNQHDFFHDLAILFLYGAISQPNLLPEPLNPPQATSCLDLLVQTTPPEEIEVSDLPASLVHAILKRAKKQGLQDYAIAYILFGTGLSVAEVVGLERSQSISDTHQHLLRVAQGRVRHVPVNQWIMERRYGSHPNNPITRWLKTRKDSQTALFLDESGHPASELDIRLWWRTWTEDLITPDGSPPDIEQAQHTWRVEMLMRGISLDDLSILTGQDVQELQPYVHRAREKKALEHAIRLDQRPGVNAVED
ncbi:MAG TPA: TetR family transcriptional regulator [Crinalium sp.]|jgi:AcrR family transcriptional regulator